MTGPNRDLHSGSFGGAVTNPANALAQILAGHDRPARQVQIPGFYDDVVPLTDARAAAIGRRCRSTRQSTSQQIGVAGAVGEEGYTALERRWARPTCDINGLWSGYQGQGAKTVLPSTAGAKFSFRLVPNQDPAKIARGLRRWLAGVCPPGVKMELIDHHGAPGVLVPLDSPYIAAAARAIEHAFGRRPVYTREGGSIPIVTDLPRRLGRRRAACWAGAKTTTTPTAPTRSSPWPTSTAASRPAPSCGRSWQRSRRRKRPRRRAS